MIKISKSKNKGFTLIELIVVIAILAILAGLVAPAYNGLREKSAESVCSANRTSVLRSFKVEKALRPNAELNSDFLEGFSCPSKGVYSIEKDTVKCSIHGGIDDSGADVDPPKVVPGSIEINHETAGKIEISPTMTIADIKAAITSGTVVVPAGTVITDETGTYILKSSIELSSANVNDSTTLSDIRKNNLGKLLSLGIEGQVSTGQFDIGDYYYANSDFTLNNGYFALGYDEIVSYNNKLYLTLKEVHDVNLVPPNDNYYLEIIQ